MSLLDLEAGGTVDAVVDASVGVKWVIEEADTPRADLLLSQGKRLIVPDRFYSEVANVLWKRTRLGDASQRISPYQAREGLKRIVGLPLESMPSDELAEDALSIALEIGRSTYDCDYLALAVRAHAPFVTADERFYKAVNLHPQYGAWIRWIGDD